MQKIRVKICCICSIEDAKLAIAYGASALGLVGHMPSGPGVISNLKISEIMKSVPPMVSTFLLTSETKAAAVIDHYKKVNTSTIQIVDALENRDYEQIKNELPHVKIVQVIHVLDDKSVAEAIGVSAYVDAVLLDSGNPNLETKELGGTGRTHNWDLSRQIRDQIDIPVFLAGGINRNNVKQAIEHVQPFGVDLCSSVRTNGKLDENKLKLFFQTIQSIHQHQSSI
jgi:phosphoribosylanthranilate isomerase